MEDRNKCDIKELTEQLSYYVRHKFNMPHYTVLTLVFLFVKSCSFFLLCFFFLPKLRHYSCIRQLYYYGFIIIIGLSKGQCSNVGYCPNIVILVCDMLNQCLTTCLLSCSQLFAVLNNQCYQGSCRNTAIVCFRTHFAK